MGGYSTDILVKTISSYDRPVLLADGSGVAFRTRDPNQFPTLLGRTVALYRRLVAEWARTSRSYRAAVPELTSVDAWRRVFERP